MDNIIATADPEVDTKAVLRRYIDLPKLLDLLHTKSLYFRRADGFSDRLEGALFPCLRQLIDSEYKQGQISQDADAFYKSGRENNYVSCWTIGAKDNMALWQLYGGTRTSVAITTTADRIIDCAIDWYQENLIHINKVKYIDHGKPQNYVIGSPREVLQYKNYAFKFENELRIVVSPYESSNSEMGISLQVNDINKLVRSIVVAPDASESYYNAVTDLCKKYGLLSPVRRSKLTFIPV